MRSVTILLALLLLGAWLPAQQGDSGQNGDAEEGKYIDDGEKSISTTDLHRHVSFLASDEMRGRLAGSPEAHKAADYIRDHMKANGLQPRGRPRKSWFHKFKLPGTVGHNVVGYLPGTSAKLKKQVVVIGAHLDHAGMGRFARDRSRVGEVHNGADDNGSGTIGLLELVEAFAKHPTKRSLLFVAFSAEEWGLFGSKGFVKKPTVPLKSMAMMINLDMIGRASNRYLFVGGVHTGKGNYDLLKELNQKFKFDLEVSGGGPGPSDMDPFYKAKVPVLFFTTGLHNEYHTPDDDVERLNLPAERDLLRMVYRLVRRVADAPKKPRWLKDDRQAMPQGSKRETDHAKVMLGVTIPRSPDSDGGIQVRKVSRKSPGGKAGIKKGDFILSVDGVTVASPLALRKLLGAAAYGTSSKVGIRRGNKNKTYKVKFVHW